MKPAGLLAAAAGTAAAVAAVVAVGTTLVSEQIASRYSAHKFADVTITPSIVVTPWSGSTDGGGNSCDGSGANQDIHRYTEIQISTKHKSTTLTLPRGIQQVEGGQCVFAFAEYLGEGAHLPYDRAGYKVSIPGHGSIRLSPEAAMGSPLIKIDASGHMST